MNFEIVIGLEVHVELKNEIEKFSQAAQMHSERPQTHKRASLT
ncbi:Glutamyl-tRNA(Gln) amidotransferase subunit B, chloroplastic/mitochondrial [Anoxybacillus sp. BCO1]|nr:Glutamyl-tRNA(Gln) amidotransferase subunit B, chloroplastic/mitochondrial [Anoxybacillus sp. BCO1]